MAPRDASGRYRGRRQGFEVQLRVDVDGACPCHRVSADYYRVTGAGTTYVGSMRIDKPVVTQGAAQLTIIGTAVFSMPSKCKRIKVRIRRASVGGAPTGAVLQHLAAPGSPGMAYECRFESSWFRTADLEEACEKGVTPVGAYDTASLPAPGTPRTLTHISAFAEAGIELVPTGPPAVIDTSLAGGDATWSDAELHAAMEEHFSRWGDRPQWAIWLLHAAAHDDPSIRGLMFDRRGLQRQGCAVFYGAKQDTRPAAARSQLFACVHELGHGFNLPHSWQRSLTDPPIPSRPDARSWMNYPELYPGGADAYWPEFEFGFDDPELVHMRHAFETDVIMGGKPFAGGAALDRTPGWDVENARDPGLRLKLRAPRAFVLEVPVTVALELAASTRQAHAVPPVLGPRPGNVEIAIRRPNGSEFVFEPLLRHCHGEDMITLRAGDDPLRDQAFIHYGRSGFAFDRPGRYLVRARYAPPDGPVVLSNVAAIEVKAPRSRADRDVARLIAGDEQVGTLMSLLGSDAPALRRGNRRLDEIIGRFPTHPVADVARLIQATNLARKFKRIDASGTVVIRPPRTDQANKLIGEVVDLSRASVGAPGALDETGRLRGQGSGTQITTKPGIDRALKGLVDSRRSEVAVTVQAGAKSTRRTVREPGASPTGQTARDEAAPPGRRDTPPSQRA